MPDAPVSPPLARPYDIDTVELLRRLRGSEAEVVARLARERDHLFLLQEALVDVERADTLQARRRGMHLRDELLHYGASSARLLEDFGGPTAPFSVAPGAAVPMLIRVPNR